MVIGYAYNSREKPVLYQTDVASCCPLILLENPFRDKSREIAAEDLLTRMHGKTVTEALNEIKEVRFNNPQGFVERGKLVWWKLSNRADAADSTIFYYDMYRGDPDAPRLNWATITVKNTDGAWKVTDYRGTGEASGNS